MGDNQQITIKAMETIETMGDYDDYGDYGRLSAYAHTPRL
jgi:hypothetical protein